METAVQTRCHLVQTSRPGFGCIDGSRSGTSETAAPLRVTEG